VYHQYLVVGGWWSGNVYVGIPLVGTCIMFEILGSYCSCVCHLIVFHSDMLYMWYFYIVSIIIGIIWAGIK
jgi:hypothetical protein